MKLSSLLLLVMALPAYAQYEITSWTIDAGGGQSTGSVYAVTGTIGQPDAGTHTGGSYAFIGGFWSFATVIQSDEVPLLHITHANAQVILAWPNASTGYQLQLSPSLSTPLWADVPQAPAIVGEEKQVTLSVEPGLRFFRLRKP
jgi:hypothetical protein